MSPNYTHGLYTPPCVAFTSILRGVVTDIGLILTQEAVTADSDMVEPSQVSYEPEVPASGVTSSTQMGESSTVCCFLQVYLQFV